MDYLCGLADQMGDAGCLKVSAFETNIGNLELEDKCYDSVSDQLRGMGLTVLYEARMGVLTELQRSLYENVLLKVPKDLVLFLDPIVISFALRDACDLSSVDYVWLDFENDDDVGCSAWMRKNDGDGVIDLAVDLMRRHLEKYLIDVYSRGTREEMVRVWEAGLGLEACSVCGGTSLKRRLIMADRHHRLRGWACAKCGNHVVIPSDALDYLKRKN